MYQNLALKILHLRVVSAWYFGFVMKTSVLVPEMGFEDQQLSPEVLVRMEQDGRGRRSVGQIGFAVGARGALFVLGICEAGALCAYVCSPRSILTFLHQQIILLL